MSHQTSSAPLTAAEFSVVLQRAQTGGMAAQKQLQPAITSELEHRSNVPDDVSDVIPQSLLAAHRHLSQFCGRTLPDFRVRLRSLIRHDLADRRRYDHRKKRRSGHVQSFDRSDRQRQRIPDLTKTDESSVRRNLLPDQQQALSMRGICRQHLNLSSRQGKTCSRCTVQ